MLRMRFPWFVIASCASCFSLNVCRADQAEDEAAIRKADEAYVEAYNKHDAKAVAALWSPEAVYVDPDTGEEAVGRDEIEKEFADTFADLKDAKLEVECGLDQVLLTQCGNRERAQLASFVRRQSQRSRRYSARLCEARWKMVARSRLGGRNCRAASRRHPITSI